MPPDATLVVAAGTTDCETISDGLLLQPVNSLSSLAFSVAGIAILVWGQRTEGAERVNRHIFGVLMILTGLGSLAFHGFDGRVWHFAHDVSFLAVVWMIAVVNVAELREWRRPVGWGAVLVGVAVFTVTLIIGPGTTNVMTALVVLALVVSDIILERSGGGIDRLVWVASLVSMGIAVLFFVLGRTGGPLCDPDSLLQGHALWHVFAAVAITLYFVSTSKARTIRSEKA